MTKEQLAEQLNGNEYGDEITPALEQVAKENNLVIVFGYSDDNIEFRGAINDEVGAYDGGSAYVTANGLFDENERDCQCKYFEAARKESVEIKAIWAKDGYSWQYKTAIPHATFEIVEDGENYCKGIVFNLDDAKQMLSAKAMSNI